MCNLRRNHIYENTNQYSLLYITFTTASWTAKYIESYLWYRVRIKKHSSSPYRGVRSSHGWTVIVYYTKRWSLSIIGARKMYTSTTPFYGPPAVPKPRVSASADDWGSVLGTAPAPLCTFLDATALPCAITCLRESRDWFGVIVGSIRIAVIRE